MQLLESASANFDGEVTQYPGGLATVYCWGNFAGASVKLMVSPNKTVWFDLDGYTLNQTSKPKNMQLSDCWIKGQVFGGGAETSINLIVRKFVN